MRKHPLNKRVRSSVPTENELTSPDAKMRHRAIVRMGRHRNMVKGAANHSYPRGPLRTVNGGMNPHPVTPPLTPARLLVPGYSTTI